MIIAIDGPAGSGKSSTALEVSRRLGFVHLDTGAMYRAITLKCLRLRIDPSDIINLQKIMDTTDISFIGVPPNMQIFMDGEDISLQIRSDEVTKNVSDYCAPLVVRDSLVQQQRRSANGQNVVCEGRDIGTVVFPDADLKFFMVASVEERAKRRQKDFLRLGIEKSFQELIQDIALRDKKDSTRENSPLKKAFDAFEIDTTEMSFNEQVDLIVNKTKELTRL